MVAAALLGAALASGCGNTHPLRDGVYSFALGEIIRDDCGQAARPDLMAGGTLVTAGHEVRFDYGFYDLKLVGTYLYSVERMRLDGSTANVTTTVGGRSCLLDLVVASLDGEYLDPTHFSGALDVRYEANRPVDCACDTWVRFNATREGP